jgi:rRNA-processing protein FCF1
MPIEIILDSNFLMLLSTFRGDILEELDKVIGQRSEKILLLPVLEELQRLGTRKSRKTEKQAKLALQLIDQYGLQILDIGLRSGESVDEFILRVAQSWNCYVATNDRQLRKQLLKVGVPVIYLRQGTRLEVKGQRI